MFLNSLDQLLVYDLVNLKIQMNKKWHLLLSIEKFTGFEISKSGSQPNTKL